MADFIDELGVGDAAEGALVEKFLGNVSSRAKPCVAKAIDYTLLVVLLLIQFMRCSPADFDDIKDLVTTNSNETITASTLYSCDIDDKSKLLYSSKTYVNVLVIMAISIGIIIGILFGAFVWIHARGIEDLPIHEWTEQLYKCTDKILVIDSALEIPISFYMAPAMTIFVWSLFAACSAGLIFLSTMYGRIVKGDENAITVFTTNALLVGLSLFKLTGEVSQYWVLYQASVSQDIRDKFDEKRKNSPPGLSSRLLNAASVRLPKKDENDTEKKDKNNDYDTENNDKKNDGKSNEMI